MKVTLILACAGKGSRAGYSENKLWQKVGDTSILERSLSVFKNSGLIDEFIITASQTDFDKISTLYGNECIVVKGGDTRTKSVINALDKTTGDIVLIHDGARPFVTQTMIKDCINSACAHGGTIPVVPSSNTIVSAISKSFVENYLGKDGLYSVQTPQGFKTNLIKKAYALAGARAYNDDGEVYKTFIGPLATYSGDSKNVKLTYPEDFTSSTNVEYRFGTGFDCHKLVEERALILGGVSIPHDKGLLGHSDADVLTHAIMDAILSAYANRDIGYHFSDKDPKYENACSMDLLKTVLDMTINAGYKVDSVSASIMAEKPKLLKHIPTITENLAKALNLSTDKVGITATTLEGLGFVGREEGICTHATATLIKIN